MNDTPMRPARVNPLLLNAHEERRSLDGDWRFRLDPDDVGRSEAWFRTPGKMIESIQVPGCWQGQGLFDYSNEKDWYLNLEARVFRSTY